MEDAYVQAQRAIQDCVKLYNEKNAIEIDSGELRAVTTNDYAVFIRDSGYAVILKSYYTKLGKKKRDLLTKGCSYVSL